MASPPSVSVKKKRLVSVNFLDKQDKLHCAVAFYAEDLLCFAFDDVHYGSNGKTHLYHCQPVLTMANQVTKVCVTNGFRKEDIGHLSGQVIRALKEAGADDLFVTTSGCLFNVSQLVLLSLNPSSWDLRCSFQNTSDRVSLKFDTQEHLTAAYRSLLAAWHHHTGTKAPVPQQQQQQQQQQLPPSLELPLATRMNTSVFDA